MADIRVMNEFMPTVASPCSTRRDEKAEYEGSIAFSVGRN